MADGLGPFTDVDVITVGTTIPEINQLLAQGWRLLSISIHEEVLTTGAATRNRSMRRVAVGTLGRKILDGEDFASVREQASEQGEDAMAPVEVAPLDIGEPDNEVTPLEIPPADPPAAPAVTRGRPPRRIAQGTGEFEASGIRG